MSTNPIDRNSMTPPSSLPSLLARGVMRFSIYAVVGVGSNAGRLVVSKNKRPSPSRNVAAVKVTLASKPPPGRAMLVRRLNHSKRYLATCILFLVPRA